MKTTNAGIWMHAAMHAHLANAFFIDLKTSFLISCPWSILGLLQDLVSDFDKGLDWDVVAQRGAHGKTPGIFQFQ